MVVPYANRNAVITIPSIALKEGKLSCNCEELIKDLVEQTPNLKDTIKCFVWLSKNKVRVTAKSRHTMEDFIFTSYTFRGHPLEIEASCISERSPNQSS